VKGQTTMVNSRLHQPDILHPPAIEFDSVVFTGQLRVTIEDLDGIEIFFIDIDRGAKPAVLAVRRAIAEGLVGEALRLMPV
jgi:hypothetical protein